VLIADEADDAASTNDPGQVLDSATAAARAAWLLVITHDLGSSGNGRTASS